MAWLATSSFSVSVRQLGQRPLQAIGVAGQLDAGGVREVLALPVDGHLHQACEERREDGHQQAEDEDEHLAAATATAAAPAAAHAAPDRHAREHVRHQRDGADEHAHQQAEADVVVGDVRELVADDALQLFAIEPLAAGRA